MQVPGQSTAMFVAQLSWTVVFSFCNHQLSWLMMACDPVNNPVQCFDFILTSGLLEVGIDDRAGSSISLWWYRGPCKWSLWRHIALDVNNIPICGDLLIVRYTTVRERRKPHNRIDYHPLVFKFVFESKSALYTITEYGPRWIGECVICSSTRSI